MKNQKGFTTIEILTLIYLLYEIVGAILNIYQVVTSFIALENLVDISGLLAIKTICIFIPLVGSTLGWFGLFM